MHCIVHTNCRFILPRHILICNNVMKSFVCENECLWVKWNYFITMKRIYNIQCIIYICISEKVFTENGSPCPCQTMFEHYHRTTNQHKCIDQIESSVWEINSKYIVDHTLHLQNSFVRVKHTLLSIWSTHICIGSKKKISS